jgi:DNA replication licensing factor MCM7
LAKSYQPILPAVVGDYIVNAYVHLRKKAHETAEFQYTCARTLLSVIRLASALVYFILI